MFSLGSVIWNKAEFLVTVKSGEGDGKEQLGFIEKAVLGKVVVKVVVKYFCVWGRWNETSTSIGVGRQKMPAFFVFKYFGLLTSGDF